MWNSGIGIRTIVTVLLITTLESGIVCKTLNVNDICGKHEGTRLYLELGEKGSLVAKYENNEIFYPNYYEHRESNNRRCKLEFITCQSCVVEIKFRFLNITKSCGKTPVFDSCGCDYVLIYEPPYEEVSGEQFCGRFIQNNVTKLGYTSQTRHIAISFLYSSAYDHVFTIDYSAERNRMFFDGAPTHGNINNASQIISSPFFPYYYPSDLNVEYVINCKTKEKCRINLSFTDFKISPDSIIEFFDWNGQRMYAATGNVFRPPIIFSTGPTLVIRFYANGGTSLGYKAIYSYILGDYNETILTPNTNCGGNVNNLGGGITMMNMVKDGTKPFDCIWLVRPPNNYLHMKTHLYVKVITFSDFAGTTDLTIHQGMTSTEPVIENLRNTISKFIPNKDKEHVVPISQGFYISLKGLFTPDSRLAIVYAAFNYKDCFAGSDFLCQNLRCISVLLRCDGFDHCGDNSDELVTCSEGAQDRREWSKRPNFLFPKVDPYSDLTTASLIFLTCSFGLIGLIFGMAALIYRINLKARHQRRIQDHIETIHAILEEGVVEVEEEILVPDEPPDYEAPPDYQEVLKMGLVKKKVMRRSTSIKSLKGSQSIERSRCSSESKSLEDDNFAELTTSIGCQTTPIKIPDSPPPGYVDNFSMQTNNFASTSTQYSSRSEVLLDNAVQCNSCVVLPVENSPSSQNIENIKVSVDIQPIYDSYQNSLSSTESYRSLKKVYFSDEISSKYYSDSELTCLRYKKKYSIKQKRKVSNLFTTKSFSSDDIFLM